MHCKENEDLAALDNCTSSELGNVVIIKICKCDSLTGNRLMVSGAWLASCQLDFWCDWITGSRNSRMIGWIRNSLPSELRFPSLILKACICVLDMSICMVYSMSCNFPVSVILWEEVQQNSWLLPPKFKSPLSTMLVEAGILVIHIEKP